MKWKTWLYGLIAANIGGGATSLSAWLGMVGAKAVGIQVPDLNLNAVFVIFLSGALASACAYLKQSPLPAVIDNQK